MAKYKLTLEQFKEFVAPFIKEMNKKFVEKEHKQLEFDIGVLFNDENEKSERYELYYNIIGYHMFGNIIIEIKNCFEIVIHNELNKAIDTADLSENLCQNLWQYCFALFGEEYRQNLMQYLESELTSHIIELNRYIKGIEDADIYDMFVAESEIKAAKDEIAYLEQEYENNLEFVHALGVIDNI